MSKQKSISFYMEQEMQKYMTPDAKNAFLCAWYRYMFPYIPFQSGLMASLIDFPEEKEALKEFLKIKLSPEQAKEIGLSLIEADSRNIIHFRAPYASIQYEGENFNFTRDLHQLAQAHWAQVADDLHGEEIIKEYVKYVKKKHNL